MKIRCCQCNGLYEVSDYEYSKIKEYSKDCYCPLIVCAVCEKIYFQNLTVPRYVFVGTEVE